MAAVFKKRRTEDRVCMLDEEEEDDNSQDRIMLEKYQKQALGEICSVSIWKLCA